MRISTEGKIGLGLALVLGLASGAIMVWPEYKEIGWSVMGLSAAGLAALSFYHLRELWATRQRARGKRVMLAFAGMLLFGFCFLVCVAVYFRPTPAAPPLNLYAEKIALDTTDGLKDRGIVWHAGYGRTMVVLSNNTDHPVTDITLRVKIDIGIIMGATHSPLNNCVLQAVGLAPSGMTGVVNGHRTIIIGSESGGGDEFITQEYRMLCDKLPARSTIELTLATVKTDWDIDGEMYDKKHRGDAAWLEYDLHYAAKGEDHQKEGRIAL